MFICLRERQFPGAGSRRYKLQSIVNHARSPEFRYEKQDLCDTTELDAGNRYPIVRSHRPMSGIVCEGSEHAE